MSNERCFYCGVWMTEKGADYRGVRRFNERTTDHVVPQAKRDERAYDLAWASNNCVQACFKCNGDKADMWPLDWLEIMPDFGVGNLIGRLRLLGCEQELIDEHLRQR